MRSDLSLLVESCQRWWRSKDEAAAVLLLKWCVHDDDEVRDGDAGVERSARALLLIG